MDNLRAFPHFGFFHFIFFSSKAVLHTVHVFRHGPPCLTKHQVYFIFSLKKSANYSNSHKSLAEWTMPGQLVSYIFSLWQHFLPIIPIQEPFLCVCFILEEREGQRERKRSIDFFCTHLTTNRTRHLLEYPMDTPTDWATPSMALFDFETWWRVKSRWEDCVFGRQLGGKMIFFKALGLEFPRWSSCSLGEGAILMGK